MANQIQIYLNDVTGWCEDTNSKMNPAKAATLWCSLNNHIIRKDVPAVEISHCPINREEMQYLGINLDRSLSFKGHVDHTIQKAKKGLTAVKAIAHMELEQRLLQALVLSVIDCGLGIVIMSKTQIARLDKVHIEGMRTILGCTRVNRFHATHARPDDNRKETQGSKSESLLQRRTGQRSPTKIRNCVER